VEDMHYGKVGPARLFGRRRELLPPVGSLLRTCVVLLDGYLARFKYA
jgi:hypothetical protein